MRAAHAADVCMQMIEPSRRVVKDLPEAARAIAEFALPARAPSGPRQVVGG